MNKIYRVAIIGGGAAGLIAAVDLSRGKNAISGTDVIVIERNDRVGKKLAVTGNGQGNLTNSRILAENYYGDKKFISEFIELHAAVDLKRFFESIGIPLTEGKDGKIYPLSKQASSVLDIVRLKLSSAGVKEQTSTRVNAIKKTNGRYEIVTDNGVFYADNVIVAVGGAAAKQFGTDGSSYALLEKLGHKKTEIYPSLVQLKTDLAPIRGLKGLKETAKVTAFYKGKAIKSATGDLLFTEFGVSGSTIFAISAAITGLDGVKLKIEFLPELTEEEIEKILADRQKLGYIKDEDALVGVINKRIGRAVIKSAGSATAEGLARALKNFTIGVTGNLGFNYAQVTKGGIDTDDINPRTTESKLSENLYLVGEVLNVDGDCGGYNLTFAFVTAITASAAIKNRIKNLNDD